MRDILVILNPAARSSHAQEQVAFIRALASQAEVAMTTDDPGSTQSMAAEAVRQGYRVVVAAGGDGTVNAVVNGLAGSEVALGVLPAGTMNVFAAELGLPTELSEAWEVIIGGRRREIDLGEVNGQYFVQLAGVGLDAQVVQETTWEMKRSLGPLAYLVATAHVSARPAPRLTLQADGRTWEGAFALIGNGRYYGTRLEFFREAKLDDGLLDVLVFQKAGWMDLARYFGAVLIGRHTALPEVACFQAREVRVTSEETVPVEVDGELATVLPVTFRIAPHRLGVMVPGGKA